MEEVLCRGASFRTQDGATSRLLVHQHLERSKMQVGCRSYTSDPHVSLLGGSTAGLALHEQCLEHYAGKGRRTMAAS